MSLFNDYKDINNPKYDKYLPIDDNLNLQQYDNYCIYDMAAITYYYHYEDRYYADYAQTQIRSYDFFDLKNPLPPVKPPQIAELDSWVAWQKFNVTPITVDFRALVDRYRSIVTTTGYWRFMYTFIVDYDPNDTQPTQFLTELIAAEPIKVGTDRYDFSTIESFVRDSVSFPLGDAYKREVFIDTYPDYEYAQPIRVLTRFYPPGEHNTNGFNIPPGLGTESQFLWVNDPVDILKPNYADLLKGYPRDPRRMPTGLVVTSPVKTTLTLNYYRENTLERTKWEGKNIPKSTIYAPAPEWWIDGGFRYYDADPYFNPGRYYYDRGDYYIPYSSSPYTPSSPLRSIDWHTDTIDLLPNIPTFVDCTGITLGTLQYTTFPVSALNIRAVGNNTYPLAVLLNDLSALDNLFTTWTTLYTNKIGTPRKLNNLVDRFNSSKITFNVLSATNDYWQNNTLPILPNSDSEVGHPFFTPIQTDIYRNHLVPITGNEIGTIPMDSPRVVEIHKALNATMYQQELPARIGGGTVEAPDVPAKHKLDWYLKITAKTLGNGKLATYIDPDTGYETDRVSDLGWYIVNIARVLGLRVDEKACIDSGKEDKYYKRQILNNPKYDKNAYSKNSFGRFGRLTPHLTNSNGKKAFDKIADIPQMIEACFEHVNRSIGIQQGTEIEVLNSTTGKKDYYPNQLSMLLDIHAKITEIQLNAKENHNLLQVMAHEVRELFSGIGIPVSFKTLYSRYGKFLYLGHQSERGSILTSLTTLKVNVGMLVGNLLIDRPRNLKNPLERIFAKKSDREKGG